MMDEGGRMNIGYLIFHPSSLIPHPSSFILSRRGDMMCRVPMILTFWFDGSDVSGAYHYVVKPDGVCAFGVRYAVLPCCVFGYVM